MLFQLAHQRFFIALLSMDMLIFASPANQFPCGLVTFGTVCMRSISFVHPAGINLCSLVTTVRMFVIFRTDQILFNGNTALIVDMPCRFTLPTDQRLLLLIAFVCMNMACFAITANQCFFITGITVLMLLTAIISSLLQCDSRQNQHICRNEHNHAGKRRYNAQPALVMLAVLLIFFNLRKQLILHNATSFLIAPSRISPKARREIEFFRQSVPVPHIQPHCYGNPRKLTDDRP